MQAVRYCRGTAEYGTGPPTHLVELMADLAVDAAVHFADEILERARRLRGTAGGT